ncbi:HK97 gp10 family phage protein [Mycobacterium xenopi]|uniref:HK97 gp10 family phage protein n=1 Tax=Mycobacterium xenopi TaxID=1789 RepID=A0AAD1GZ89_MYCXE|nr:HK97 gp10 family phage protein [Mycobacterium xenopi]ORX21604.1 hypothetical protein AWC32_21575 [Mycobacterium xenopi]BBU22159.1 hypothetical protein MYXE_19490 [Mycobacterium xenopi]SPX78026.1 Bacteriophage protein of uncharacterised function (DUF646) [Mycobacterium xenopi]
MSYGFDRFGVSDAEIEAAIAASAEVDAQLNAFMENEFVPAARNNAPIDHGAYAAGIKVTKQARGGKGQVGATHWTSHFIEYGTGSDPAGTHSRFGPNTPTPEFAPMQKTAEQFGGTLDDGDHR